jgi:SOS response regulatory protein OraA/RecX
MSGKSPMDTALILLGRHPLTEQQLAKKLSESGFDPEDISETLNRLKGWGYLNDSEYGINRINTLLSRFKSRVFVEGDLLAHGLEPELIQELLHNYYPETLEIDIARQLLRRKSPVKRQSKTWGQAFLIRSGFSENTVHQCFPEVSST